ncbi:TetR/AcrR family transcriptional regulator [Nocardia sp. CNY236]|uniref:TetR/AcrR family transcriptional regulator n=1 Tax=Nocardia sp. CNY236 TaxID=1169152 RepID=UPI0003F67F83|nr:TetR/AcrR family transcriptional regulator [Nocardia sp. CNY236]
MIPIDIPTSRPTKRQLRALRTAADLKTAARAVFARQGYLNTKITDITMEAGRAAGSFYNHFDSKEEILAALAVDIGADADEIAGSTPPSPTAANEQSIYQSTRMHVAVFWHTYTAHRDVFAAIEQATLANPAFAQRMRAFRSEQLQPWIDWLTELSDQGARLPAEPAVTAAMVATTAETMIQFWRGDPETGIDNLTIFIATGLSAGSAPS